MAAYFGVKHAVLSSSWTAAVHLLHIAQNLKSGDEILVPSLTAFPSIEPMIHVGAKPIFCDIDDTYTIDLADAAKRITKRTVGILPVHLYGRPANIDGILKLAEDHGLWVIEDCAQSHGAKWKNTAPRQFRRSRGDQLLSLKKPDRLRRRRRDPHQRSRNGPPGHHAPQPRPQRQISS